MTEEKKKQIQALLTPFGQTLNDLPHAYTTAERFQARAFAYGLQNSGNYPSYICYLLDVIDRMAAALKAANDRWDNLSLSIQGLAENCRPYEDQRDAGYDEACSEILSIMGEERGGTA